MKSLQYLLSLLLSSSVLLAQQNPSTNTASPQPPQVKVEIVDTGTNKVVPIDFLGLSYEASMLLADKDRHYFDATNTPLVSMFRTLGIKSLRVGANAVDDPRVAVPDEKDIDALFGFAKAAGVKVIYSFRLKNGDPARSAQLAKYIQDHYVDLLDCFAIGNEPDCFEQFKREKYGFYFTAWKPHYDAILQSVPHALIEGPSVASKGSFAINLAKDLGDSGHLPMVSCHYYVFGSGRNAEQDLVGTRERFLSESNATKYQKLYEETAKPLALLKVPYRIDEMNSCYNGGAKGASDTYSSALWSLDWDHWWASKGIEGVNYHTGESVGMNGGFHAPNYASFVHLPNESGFNVRPISYAHLAFKEGAKGRPMQTHLEGSANVSVYSYRDGDTYLVTVVNKEHAPQELPVQVTLSLPKNSGEGMWERLDLVQKSGDIAASSDISVGEAPISPGGLWNGHWKVLSKMGTGTIKVDILPASASIFRFTTHPGNNP